MPYEGHAPTKLCPNMGADLKHSDDSSGKKEVKALGPWPDECGSRNVVEVKDMTYIPNRSGMVSIEDARRILRAIFPNYPDLNPCHPAPILEPITPPMQLAL